MLKQYENGKWMERESLAETLGLTDESIRVVSIVGAGGKTTCLRRLQLECKKLEIRAAAGTTTHIQYERNESFLECPDLGAAREILEKTGTLWMGEPVSEWKCKALPEHFYRELLGDGIRLLLEADGAKEYPVKAPRDGEPVILPETGLVLCLYGLDAVGQAIRDACCRVEQVCRILGKQETDRLTAVDLAKLAVSPRGGRKGIQSGMHYAVLFNKADIPEREAMAQEAAREIGDRADIILTASQLMPPWKTDKTGEIT